MSVNDPMGGPMNYEYKRSFGLDPAPHVTAVDQLQKSFPSVGIQLMPSGTPGRCTPDRVGIVDSPSIRFTMIGDSGGIKDATFQNDVASAIIDRLVADQTIAFCYHDGDEVYFNGAESEYASQFYEPYAHFNRPIVGVPGNHDGSPDNTITDPTQSGIPTFMANFCDVAPHVPASDPQFEYGRHTQTQPYCDWTINLQALTIVGVWTNAPSGGYLTDKQIAWLTQELQAAPEVVPVMIVLHHPPYSVDAHHGGSSKMGAALDQCFEASKRCADIVVSGHVHNYQRFTRTYWSRQIPYIVVGNSGYHNLHALATGATPGEQVASDVVFNFGDASNFGFLVVSAAGGSVQGEYVAVGRDGTRVDNVDKFVVTNGVVS